MCDSGGSGGGASYDNRESLRARISHQNESKRYEQEFARLAAETEAKNKLTEWEKTKGVELRSDQSRKAALDQELEKAILRQKQVQAQGGQYTGVDQKQAALSDIQNKIAALESERTSFSGSNPFQYDLTPIVSIEDLKSADTLKSELASLQSDPSQWREVTASPIMLDGRAGGPMYFYRSMHDTVAVNPNDVIRKDGKLYYDPNARELNNRRTQLQQDLEKQSAFEQQEAEKMKVFGDRYNQELQDAEAQKLQAAQKAAADQEAEAKQKALEQENLAKKSELNAIAARSSPEVSVNTLSTGAKAVTGATPIPPLARIKSAPTKRSYTNNTNKVSADSAGLYRGQSNLITSGG